MQVKLPDWTVRTVTIYIEVIRLYRETVRIFQKSLSSSCRRLHIRFRRRPTLYMVELGKGDIVRRHLSFWGPLVQRQCLNPLVTSSKLLRWWLRLCLTSTNPTDTFPFLPSQQLVVKSYSSDQFKELGGTQVQLPTYIIIEGPLSCGHIMASPAASTMLKARVHRPSLLKKLCRPEDLLHHFPDGAYIGWSGFTGVGYPKYVACATRPPRFSHLPLTAINAKI